ncbi:MAG: hypothetical protein WBO73_14215 [Gammaproteobacteria bacterium]|jgi:hypothetical protein
MTKNTMCFLNVAITVQAGLGDRKLALHSNRSYGYAFRSRAALTNTNPAPAPVILVRNAGYDLILVPQNKRLDSQHLIIGATQDKIWRPVH